MDDHSSVDISIRNVTVRLNESNKTSEMNGDCVNSLFVSSSTANEMQGKCFNQENEENCHSNGPDISDELCDKLHIGNDSSKCGFINGCSTLLHEDIKCVDLSVNGLTKNNFELLNAHLSKIGNRTCIGHSPTKLEVKRTEVELSKNLSSDTISDCVNFAPIAENQNSVVRDVSSDESSVSEGPTVLNNVNITYLGYESERQMPDIMRLIQKDLSEPYSIYTYRYFIHNWPKLCFLAQDSTNQCVGAIVCKLDVHKKQSRRGYIAMLAVDENHRKKKIGSNLVLKAIHAMVQDNADEVVLETEITNKPALRLYENLGFVRDKRLFRYYLNGVDALRLKLWLR